MRTLCGRRKLAAAITTALLVAGCHNNTTAPTQPPSTGPSKTSTLVATFTENPVPFRSSGCNASTPQGWYTTAQIQETAGVAFTPSTFTQKLDGSIASALAESFNSRFGACAGGAFNENVIPANGTVCGVVGVCTSTTYSNYQFELTGTDANGHAVTFVSPMLQFGSRPAGQSVSRGGSSAPPPTAPTALRPQ